MKRTESVLKIVGNEDFKADCKEYKNKKNEEILKKCIHDIRNIKTLNKGQLNNIVEMSNDDKMLIIVTFNCVIEQIKDLI